MLSYRVLFGASRNCTGSGKVYKRSGVIMDVKMNFSEHVDVMGGKAFAMLGFSRYEITVI
jgi:hypothetical protein